MTETETINPLARALAKMPSNQLTTEAIRHAAERFPGLAKQIEDLVVLDQRPSSSEEIGVRLAVRLWIGGR